MIDILAGAVLVVLGYALMTDRWGVATWFIALYERTGNPLDPRSGPRTRSGARRLGIGSGLLGMAFLAAGIFSR
jgi:hypothetical protein